MDFNQQSLAAAQQAGFNGLLGGQSGLGALAGGFGCGVIGYGRALSAELTVIEQMEFDVNELLKDWDK